MIKNLRLGPRSRACQWVLALAIPCMCSCSTVNRLDDRPPWPLVPVAAVGDAISSLARPHYWPIEKRAIIDLSTRETPASYSGELAQTHISIDRKWIVAPSNFSRRSLRFTDRAIPLIMDVERLTSARFKWVYSHEQKSLVSPLKFGTISLNPTKIGTNHPCAEIFWVTHCANMILIDLEDDAESDGGNVAKENLKLVADADLRTAQQLWDAGCPRYLIELSLKLTSEDVSDADQDRIARMQKFFDTLLLE